MRRRTRRLATIATLTAALATPLAIASPAHAECFRVEVAYQALGSPERVVVDDASCIGPLRDDAFVSGGHDTGDPQLLYVRVYFMVIEPPVEPPS